MLTHTIRRSCTTCIRFVIAFAILDVTPPSCIMASTPVLPADDPPVVARIDAIVVGENATPEINRVKVTRAQVGTEEAAYFNMALYDGDVVETDIDTQVTILYPDVNDPSAINTEVIVYPDSKVVIGSAWILKGYALINRFRGYFGTGTNAGGGGTVSTEFRVSFTNNEFELTVLEGTVDALAFDITLNGDPESKDFTFKNTCKETHRFGFARPDMMPWLEIKPSTVELKSDQTAKVVPTIRLKSEEPPPEPGTYGGQVTKLCLNCENDFDCHAHSLLAAAAGEGKLEVTVRKSSSGPIEPVTKKQELKRKSRDTAEPKSRLLSYDEVKDRVNETSDRIIKASSFRVAPNVFLNFDSPTERNIAFKCARFISVVNDDESTIEKMADVYLDWGKTALATQAYEKFEKSKSFKNTSTFRVNYGEALRASGKLKEAEEQLKQAVVMEKDERSARSLTAEGNLYLDSARRAIKLNEDKSKILDFIQKAQNSYDKANLKLRKPEAKPQQKAVALTNLGDLYSVKRDFAYEKGPPPDCPPIQSQCVRQLNNEAFKAYDAASKHDSAYTYAHTGLGYANLGRANIAMLTGDTKAQEYIDKAETEFSRAKDIDPTNRSTYSGLRLAYSKLGTSSSSEARSTSLKDYLDSMHKPAMIKVPPTKGKPRPVAMKILTDVGLIPVADGDGDIVTGQSPEAGTMLPVRTKVILKFDRVEKVFRKPN